MAGTVMSPYDCLPGDANLLQEVEPLLMAGDEREDNFLTGRFDRTDRLSSSMLSAISAWKLANSPVIFLKPTFLPCKSLGTGPDSLLYVFDGISSRYRQIDARGDGMKPCTIGENVCYTFDL